MVGAILLIFVMLVAFVGPLVAPYSPSEPLSIPSLSPGDGFMLGTDFLGRDVLSRLLNGGRSVILIGLSATLLAYFVGVLIGIYAGYRGGLGDALAMRSVDVVLAFPPLLILLLLVGGFGQRVWVLIVGVIVVQIPGISRITRTASLSVAKMSYVEAAQARGDTTLTIWRRDILPNILPSLLADFGVRFAVSIILVASMNYLGLGLAPPASDWGLMTSENQATITLNPAAVLAPAIMLALLTVSINLLADAYVRTVSGSGVVKLLKSRGIRAFERVYPRPSSRQPSAGQGSNSTDRPEAPPTSVGVPYALALDDLRVVTATGVPIVEGVSLRVAEGEILGLVGESGSGKTSTALSLFGVAQGGAQLAHGIVSTSNGRAFDLTKPKTLAAMRGRYLSYVPQSPGTALNPTMRVGHALSEMQKHRNKDDPQGRTDLFAERSQILDVVGLPSMKEFQLRFPHQLSGGQQQRVCLAIALLSGSKAIVLDEPTTGLDVVTQASVIQELRRLQRERSIAMVYISHDLAVVAQLASRVAVMYAGKVVEIGSAQQVLTRPAHPYTRGLLSSTPDHRSTPLLQPMPGVAMSLTERSNHACSFAPRCSHATSTCESVEPELAHFNGADQMVSCHHPIGAKFKALRGNSAAGIEVGSDSVLTVDGLTVEHRVRGVKVAAVSDVSLTVARGECLAVVGESGSGKTTIARAIAGIQRYETGSIMLRGESLGAVAAKRSAEQRRRVQIVFQNASLALNPREDVHAAITRSLKLCRSDARRSVADLMDLVRLPRELTTYLPKELSGGERQRVALARALATDPDLMICDEITSALDVSVQAAVLTLLHDLRRQLGLSLLFITHDLGVVANLADRILVLQHGVVRETGATREVLDSPLSEYAKTLMNAAPSLTVVTRTSDHAR